MARSMTILFLALISVGFINAAQPSDNFCPGCRALVSFVEKFNSTQNRAEYRDLFKHFCELYYPPSTDFQTGLCPSYVTAFYTILDLVDPVYHCDQIGACGPTQNVSYITAEIENMPPKQADVICTFCEQSLEQIQISLSDPKFVDQVKRQVDQLCEFLKVVDADKECRQLMHKYLDEALDFVRKIDPQLYCRSLRLCPAPPKQQSTLRPLPKKSGTSRSHALNAAAVGTLTENNAERQLPTLADFNDFGIETSVLVGGVEQIGKPDHKGPNCALCKMVVKELFHILHENKTEANIIKALDEICLLFPNGDKRDQCMSMVKAYTRELIQLLADETDPDMVCTLIEQCLGSGQYPAYSVASQRSSIEPAQTRRSKFNLANLIQTLDPASRLISGKACFECKMFIKYLQNTLEETKSREAIKTWLIKNLCQSIPDKQTVDDCSRLVDEYADTFFEAVAGSLNPSTACTELGACTRKTLTEVLQIDTMAPIDRPDKVPSLVFGPKKASAISETSAYEARKQQQAVKGQMCDQCIDIVKRIDEYLANHPIDQDLSVLIDKVCNKISQGPTRDQCIHMIETFGSEIAQAVSTMENPRQLCTQILLC